MDDWVLCVDGSVRHDRRSVSHKECGVNLNEKRGLMRECRKHVRVMKEDKNGGRGFESALKARKGWESYGKRDNKDSREEVIKDRGEHRTTRIQGKRLNKTKQEVRTSAIILFIIFKRSCNRVSSLASKS